MRQKTSSEWRARETSENVEIEILPETEYSDSKRNSTHMHEKTSPNKNRTPATEAIDIR